MGTDSIEERIYRFLAGDWVVRRRFEGSYSGTFSGKANFTPQADKFWTYRYTEQGELTDSAGKTFDAKQSYLYRLAEGKLQVLKREASDWMVMHDLDFVVEDDGKATASHVHLCGQDHYAATYRIDLNGNGWEIAYTVSGPNKDYRIESLFERRRRSPGDSEVRGQKPESRSRKLKFND